MYTDNIISNLYITNNVAAKGEFLLNLYYLTQFTLITAYTSADVGKYSEVFDPTLNTLCDSSL